MKTSLPNRLLRGAILAAALSASMSARAEPVPGAMEAIQAWLGELQQAQKGKAPIPVVLDRMARQQPTPATAVKLRDAFGTDRLFSIARVPAAPGGTQYRMTILPVHHAAGPLSRIDWDEGSVDLVLDKAGVLNLKGSWDKIAGSNGGVNGTVQGIGLDGRQSRSKDGLWFGAAAARVASVRVGNESKEFVALDGLGIAASSIDHGKTVDITYDISLAGAGMADQRIEDLHIALRLSGIERRTMLEMQAASERLRAAEGTMTSKQKSAAMDALLRSYARLLLARGGLDIDDISARYHGSKATIKGRVALPGAVQADLKDAKSLAAKLTAQFDVQVPLALVHDIADQAAARQMAARAAAAAQKGEPVPAQDPAAVAQLGQTITDVIVGRLVGNGYARMENDVLLSTLDLRPGVLRANGKQVDFAKLTGSGAAAPGASAPVPPVPPAPPAPAQ